MTSGSPADSVPRFDRFKTMLRGLRASGMCVMYQDNDLNVLMVENAPEFWPSRREIMDGGDAMIFERKVAERVKSAKLGVIEDGIATRIEVPVVSEDQSRWFEVTVEPDTDPSGAAKGIFVAAVEITDLVHREQVLKTLLREVSHRSKNLLAIMQSIAMQTARFSDTLDDFLLKFRGRIQSLSQSQDLVTDSNWRGARFSELLSRQLARYIASNVGLVRRNGVDCYLNPNAALHVGLAIHELSVNSAVYGVLSEGYGHVDIETHKRDEGSESEVLEIRWLEHLAGAADVDAVRARFGSTVLERVVPKAVGGSAIYEIALETVQYRLEIPSSQYEC
ncbi:sensor histidine kinase [Pararhizobium mangrovi]|uniref:histidine kinase n=1 Tax=Pararhizobium mangrovi TaxID=2590452 RepID=A0A506U0H4_9HYPH|nr:sensor histidine kinase [Pararhizobium mangrovi]TPW26691.1 sensor histidine kinase [Pararhizobium mangrovi]